MKPKPSKKLRNSTEKALGWTCTICQWCYPFGACGTHYPLVDGSQFSVCATCLNSPAFTTRYQHYLKNKMFK